VVFQNEKLQFILKKITQNADSQYLANCCAHSLTCKKIFMKKSLFSFILTAFSALSGWAQTANIQVLATDRQQVMDGFGSHQGDAAVNQPWWQQLYYNDLGASIYRVDLTPKLKAPHSNLSYYSPWFMGSSVKNVFNLEDPANPNGPENNRVRTYTGPNDYSRTFGGQNAPIAIMGPNIDNNMAYFTYSPDGAISSGMAQKVALGDFKLIGSFWSPLPWVKVASGNAWSQNWWPGPVSGAKWPFIWGGNFAGGRLDVSNTPLNVFNDAALGGTGPTSAMTQFARSTAAYVKGYQQYHKAKFYAISIQNELNFEQFYNSATYPLSAQYIAALKATRAEFDKYPDLKDIRIMGPEDLLGGDAYGMWEYGGPVHKNLQYLKNIAADPDALKALDFVCIHGYANDGVNAAGASPNLWDWWLNGWNAAPAPGIPANIKGFAALGKKSWMTETSGEEAPWRAPNTGFPNNGGWSIALKIHQALTTGRQSAWVYWTFTEADDQGKVTISALSNQASGAAAPKYVAAKHFFKYIRPGAQRVTTTVSGSNNLLASAYLHDANSTMTIVLINTGTTAQTATLQLSGTLTQPATYEAYSSADNNYWQQSTPTVNNNNLSVSVPAYGVVTLYGKGVKTTTVTGPEAATAVCNLHVYPNPFQTQTMIRYQLLQNLPVQLTLTNSAGKTLRTLVQEDKKAGEYALPLEADGLVPGVYFLKLQCGGAAVTQKIILVKP